MLKVEGDRCFRPTRGKSQERETRLVAFDRLAIIRRRRSFVLSIGH